MTPHDKAVELTYKFYNRIEHTLSAEYSNSDWEIAKLLAQVAVNEILESQPSYRYWDTYEDETPSAIVYWQEVKEELKKI